MARLTFKQFLQIKEDIDFVTDPQELLPVKKVDEIDKATGKPTGNKVPNPERKKQQEKDFWNFTKTARLAIAGEKPETTQFKPDEHLKPVQSGGGAKKSTLSRIGKFKTNIDFLGAYGHYYPGPELLGQIQRSPSIRG
jgi:hypothetical protein